MSRSAALSFLTVPIAKGRELIQTFGQWWLRGFLDLFPQRIADWLVDEGGRSLVLAPESETIALYLKTDRGRLLASSRVSPADYSPRLIDEFLRSHRQDRARVAVGLRLPGELVFQRSFVLPVETRRTLDAVVVQDLLAKTPFQLDDIHHAHRVRRAGDKLVVSQCVVRRAHVAATAESLALEPGEIGFIEPPDAGHDDGPPPIIRRQSSLFSRDRWIQRFTFGLAGTALLLATTAVCTKHYHQQGVLDELQGKVADAAAKAKGVLAAIEMRDQQQALLLRLRAKRDEPRLLDIWEEATRLLPAHSWLSELRVSEAAGERHVVMTGFSAAATSLVGLVDQSPIFTEAALVGPIAVDPVEGKERFIVQVKLKPPASPRTASR